MKKIILLVISSIALFACSDSNKIGENHHFSGRGDYLTSGSGAFGTQADLEYNVGDRVFFALNSSKLDSTSQDTLLRQAAWVKKNPGVKVVIEGHCDERGPREYNLGLGERRANAVKRFLVSAGVDESKISTISYGKERPAVMGSNADAWAQNRRSVMVVD